MPQPRPGPAEVLNTCEPATPRPAASVVLLRRGARHRDLEVLLVKRSPDAAFMPSVWVFPGGAVDREDGDAEAGFRACAVRELAEEAGITLDGPDELVLFSRWITPELIKTRFDAWFFLALAPAHSPPEPDGIEITEARWFEPQAALDAGAAGELALVFPTIRQLEALLEFESSEGAIDAMRERAVDPVLPKVIGEGEDRRVVLPGDPDYPA